MRPPGVSMSELCTLHHMAGLDGLEELEGLVGRKEGRVSVSPAVPWCPGQLCTSHRAGRVEKVLFGVWCSCPVDTTASICPVPHCWGTAAPAPLLGTQHPTASLQQLKVKARLVQVGGGSGHGAHRVR